MRILTVGGKSTVMEMASISRIWRSSSVFRFMSVHFGDWLGETSNSTGAGTGTNTTVAGRGLPLVCHLLRSAPALYWPGIFLVFVHVPQCIFLPKIKLSDSFRQIRRAS